MGFLFHLTTNYDYVNLYFFPFNSPNWLNMKFLRCFTSGDLKIWATSK